MKQRRQALKMLASAGVAVVAAVPQFALAQSEPAWPSRPVRIVVSSAVGGPTDLYARVLAAELAKTLGQPFVVENMPGAAGKIACQQVLNSKDGHTILFTNMSGFVLPNLVDRKPAFDVLRDFKAVAQVNNIPLFMITSAKLPVRTAAEFVAYAKSHPDSVSYASLGVGSAQQFIAEKLKAVTGIDMVHVPYKGEAPVLLDLAPNVVQVYFTGTGKRHAADPRLRVLAVAAKKRWFTMPDTATLEEQGIPGISFLAWNGIFAPAAMSDSVVHKLNAAVNAAAETEASTAWLASNGYERATGAPTLLAQRVKSDYDTYKAIVTSGAIKIED
jgi:tripartite-type tricarboxylate transporter receptor subunit TctC